jgi:glycosyltransferase involved in cell wall biosynthesis
MRGWLRDGLEYRLPDYDVSTHGPGTLFGALAEVRRRDPALASRLRLRLVGGVHESWRRAASDLGITDLVDFAGPRSFAETRRLQREADVLVMTTVSRRDGGPVPRVNAKIYEYLRAGRPVLLLSDEGDAADIARAAGLGIVRDPRDAVGLGAFLADLASDPDRVLGPLRPNADVVNAYASAALTGRLESVFRDVARSR